jgi:hypothetical protein
MERIEARSVRTDDGCLVWTGARKPTRTGEPGYGSIRIDPGHTAQVHRVVYAFHFGPPVGMVLHRCHNRPCHEPTHLYDGTAIDNERDAIERGTAVFPISPNLGITHCGHGHELTGANLLRYKRPDGRVERVCRPCKRARARTLYAKASHR